MKQLCLILLLISSLGSSLMSNQQYIYDTECELVEGCETSNTDEPTFNFLISPAGHNHADLRLSDAYLLSNNTFDYQPLVANTYHSDYLTPPPDFLFIL